MGSRTAAAFDGPKSNEKREGEKAFFLKMMYGKSKRNKTDFLAYFTFSFSAYRLGT